MSVVIGVGATFRRDDGAGPAVIDLLRRDPPPGVLLAVTDGEPARLIGLWDDTDRAVVVDAVSADPAVPGRVHELDLPGLEGVRPDPGTGGSHALGLGEAVALGAAVGSMPRVLRVFAIEGGDFGWGPGLSPPVARAVEEVAARVRAWLAGTGR